MIKLSINTDKWLHGLASAFTVVALFLILAGVGVVLWLAAVLAVVLAAAIGLGKEYIFDKFIKHGTPEIGDLIADAVGIVIGLIPILIFLL